MSLSRGQWIRTIGRDGCGVARHGRLASHEVGAADGLGWEIEHFLIYFVTTFVLCAALRRPFLIAALLMMFSGALEWLAELHARSHARSYCGVRRWKWRNTRRSFI